MASTRVSDFCACWPPGPLERETRSSISSSGIATERVTEIDPPAMAAILLDVDGVLAVSGEPIPGAAEAVRRLREEGHRLRFVTNNTTRARATLAEELREIGVDLDDDELQTTAHAAAVGAPVLGKPSPAYFGAAVEALDAEPELTWMVGDDIEADIAGAQRFGLRTVLVRTGKFRPDTVERGSVMPEGIVSSVAQLPAWLDQNA